MKLIWIGRWKKGQISIEAENVQELVKILDELEESEKIEPSIIQEFNYPRIKSSNCSGDVIKILKSDWGKAKLRNWSEIQDVLKSNAIHYSRGAISGGLTYLIQTKRLRREKAGNKYGYAIA